MCRNGEKEPMDSIKCVYVCDQIYYDKELPLADAYVTNIEDKRLLSKLLPKLTLPPSFLHLKRMHNGSILLGPVEGFEETDIRGILTELDCNFVLESVQITSNAPLTRIQYQFCQNYWPVRFKENVLLERKLSGAHFDSTILPILQQMMDIASESDGCIITNDKYKVLGRASESRMSKHEPLKHPFMRAFDHLTQSHAVAAKRSASGDQYYGTDCIVFVQNEPCPMCAMGMTHARVKTVFFKNTSAQGAFLTNCQLHLKPQLNHHYDVFRLEY